MKIVTLLGSPRKKGNTAAALGMFEKEMKAAGHEVKRVNVSSAGVKPCLSCWKCMKIKDEPGCVQKDGAAEVFKEMIAADGIVYATPLYCWCFSAQIKALIDRHVCLVKGYDSDEHNSFLAGKKTALLVTCEGPVEDNADLIQVAFDRTMGEYAMMEIVGKYIVPGCGLKTGTLPAGAGKIMKKMAADFMKNTKRK